MSKTKAVFRVMGLPKVISFEETGIKNAALAKAKAAIEHAPMTGKLVVSGVSSPILQGLFEKGRKVAAINFADMFNAKFTDTQFELPPPRAGQVTLIFAVGKEPVKNYEYSAKLLQGLINSYEALGLVIVETHLTPSTFNLQYGLQFKNKLSIPVKEEEEWA